MLLLMQAAIHRIYDPGCKFEIMVCLVGGQGAGKSSFIRLLAIDDEWFSDDLSKLGDDNIYRKLQGHWVIEMPEMLATVNAKTVEEIKAFLSRPKDNYKIPYETHPEDRPKALQEMGIAPATGQKDNETVHWQAREREYLTELCKEHEIEIEILGVDRDSYSIPEYKQAMREKENAEAEIEILHSEKIEIEEALSQIGEQLENGKEEIQDQKEVLEEINTKIAEAEKRIESKTKAMDQIISAGKSVEKEIKEIKAKASTVPNFFGGEEMVKIPKSTFDKMLSKYYAAGTFENLYKQFVKALDAKQNSIDKLTNQINEAMTKIKQFGSFIGLRGLEKDFDEFARPKRLHEYMEEKKREAEKVNQQRRESKDDKKKSHDIAI